MFRKSSKPTQRKDQPDRSIYSNTSSLSSAAQRHNITYQFQENSLYPGNSDAKSQRDKEAWLQSTMSNEHLDFNRESETRGLRSASPTKQSAVQEIVRSLEHFNKDTNSDIKSSSDLKQSTPRSSTDQQSQTGSRKSSTTNQNSSRNISKAKLNRHQGLPQKETNMLKWRYRSQDNIADERARGGNSDDATSTSESDSVESNPALNVSANALRSRALTSTSSTESVRLRTSRSPSSRSSSPVKKRSIRERTTPDKDRDSAGIRDVIEMVSSLKVQFDHIKSQLESSNKSQQSLEREINHLRRERSSPSRSTQSQRSKHKSLRRVAIANSSQSSQSDVLQSRMYSSHYDLVGGLGDPALTYQSGSQNPMVTSFIANLPPPEEMEPLPDRPVLSDESDATESTTDLELQQKMLAYRKAAKQRRSAAERYSCTSKSQQLPYNSLQTFNPSHRAQSMFDLYGASNRSNRRQYIAYQQAHRLRILKEMIESERIYCTVLWQLTENYSKLLYSTGALSRKDISQVFPPHLAQLYDQHCSLLKSLNRRLSNWNYCDIVGDAFHRFSRNKKVDLISVYKQYLGHFPKIVRVINKISRSSSLFRKVLVKSYKDGGVIGNNHALITHLVQPVKRLPYYYDVIRALLNTTPDQHGDTKYLESAAEFFKRNLKSLTKSIDDCLQVSGQPVQQYARSNTYQNDTSSYSSWEGEQLPSTKDSGIDSHEDFSQQLQQQQLQLRAQSIARQRQLKQVPHQILSRQQEDGRRQLEYNLQNGRHKSPQPIQNDKSGHQSKEMYETNYTSDMSSACTSKEKKSVRANPVKQAPSSSLSNRELPSLPSSDGNQINRKERSGGSVRSMPSSASDNGDIALMSLTQHQLASSPYEEPFHQDQSVLELSEEIISLSDNEIEENQETLDEIEPVKLPSANSKPEGQEARGFAGNHSAEDTSQQPKSLVRRSITLRPQTPEPVSLTESDSDGESEHSSDEKTSAAEEAIHGENMLGQSIASSADFEMKILLRQMAQSTPDLSKYHKNDEAMKSSKPKVRFRSPIEESLAPVTDRNPAHVPMEINRHTGQVETISESRSQSPSQHKEKKKTLTDTLKVIFNRTKKYEAPVNHSAKHRNYTTSQDLSSPNLVTCRPSSNNRLHRTQTHRADMFSSLIIPQAKNHYTTRPSCEDEENVTEHQRETDRDEPCSSV